MKTRMKKQVKKMWLKALRSGKYKQARQQLKCENKFCCLGVLVDLWRQEAKPDWDSPVRIPNINSADYVLPEHVSEWAGLTDQDPIVQVGEEEHTLASLNDNGCTKTKNKPMSFKQIANVIEKQL